MTARGLLGIGLLIVLVVAVWLRPHDAPAAAPTGTPESACAMDLDTAANLGDYVPALYSCSRGEWNARLGSDATAALHYWCSRASGIKPSLCP